MTPQELLAQIRTEIDLHKISATLEMCESWAHTQRKLFEVCDAHKEVKELIKLLDTLAVDAPEGLDEAAKAYALNTAEDSEQYSARYLGYKDGAKRQKEQDDKELSEKIAAAYQLGVKDKEQKFVDVLDEAAKKEARQFQRKHPYATIIGAFVTGAHIGAEWAFGQGETHILTVESPLLGPPMICCPVNANNGDKVIVQVRKKGEQKPTQPAP